MPIPPEGTAARVHGWSGVSSDSPFCWNLSGCSLSGGGGEHPAGPSLPVGKPPPGGTAQRRGGLGGRYFHRPPLLAEFSWFAGGGGGRNPPGPPSPPGKKTPPGGCAWEKIRTWSVLRSVTPPPADTDDGNE